MPENPEYHLRVGTTGILKPYSYYEGTELTGADIELAYRLAALLTRIVNRIEPHFNPMSRKSEDILKGIES